MGDHGDGVNPKTQSISRRWTNYPTAEDRQQGFKLDYFLTPINESKHITLVQVLTHWHAMPEASDHAPVRMLSTTQL